MADVLFDTGKYNIRLSTREQLAKLSGIILSHSGLNLQVEGHTDGTGSDEFNERLSQQRGDSVRDFLISQGLPGNGITATGLGKAMPISDNDTPAGRQKSGRVEIMFLANSLALRSGTRMRQPCELDMCDPAAREFELPISMPFRKPVKVSPKRSPSPGFMPEKVKGA